jgi:ABC-type transport system involved in cytochrome bd biosynthesis fused ATPase/permease subunit
MHIYIHMHTHHVEHTTAAAHMPCSRASQSRSHNLDGCIHTYAHTNTLQRQLICLTRVLLGHAAVILMDEATASMDSQTDALVQSAIHTHFNESTMIIIAHRIATVMLCDVVMVMDKGCTVEIGQPKELRQNKNSAFYALASEMQEEHH